ncbi:family A G protein-coupled receptor-like protein [Rhizoclosmatium globosum]|uniref:Family A G protein-coupled receptor-like protein n=1 Tax=Rhizoclosmatium globosum TaxID=329046 RepID=A0A1Y2CAW1_9FUNG|nr:family A G protein-coupled receptor-like protein [Rhizoclosmatium globosum]|eukprot:ORY44178.1 family A G protein-coupled receptor-like protein [Rhizoclosmatium globosum]
MILNEPYHITQFAISLLGLMFNGALFLMVVTESNSFNPSSYLPIWICLSDVILNTNNVLFGIYSWVTQESLVQLRSEACAFDAFIVLFSCSTSLLLLLGLTYLRYSIIVKETEVKLPIVKWGIAGSYATGALSASAPFLLGSPTIYSLSNDKLYCATSWTRRDPKTLAVIVLHLSTISIPLIFLFYAYTCIYLKIRSSIGGVRQFCSEPKLEQVETASFRPSTTSKRTSIVQRLSARVSVVSEDWRFLQQSIVMVATSLAGWSPMAVTLLYSVLTGQEISPEIDFVAQMCILVQTVFNPIYLVCKNRELRVCVRERLKLN